MLLPWVTDTMGLIPFDANSNFLKDFPLAVKRVVVSAVVRYFAQQYDHASKQVKNASHADFVMELIGTRIWQYLQILRTGQSFLLPIEDSEVINLAIEVYEKWLFKDETRPECIKEDLQKYIKVCCFCYVLVMYFVAHFPAFFILVRGTTRCEPDTIEGAHCPM